ncbi:MAG: 3'(2'),5'-bisphosphate nucleotidase CysQ, partial [Xanthomonadales bacterium]|nr:3'(2'),5'-bisphosphate nucleotidase CysQ [Xanthomonadales bacterium]
MALDLNALAHDCVAIARRAGSAILTIYEQDFEVISKADDSPLTQADLASHRVIVKALGELTPEIPVLSEESGHISDEERLSWS